MTILLQWLVEHAWIFYVGCAIGVTVYAIRALTAQRERTLALFTLERETATARIVRAWAMVLVFVAIGVIIFVTTTFVLPGLPVYGTGGTPLPTATLSAGVDLSSSSATLTPSPTMGPLPTSTPTSTATIAPIPTIPSSDPTELPSPAPTDTPELALSGQVQARFGNFAELVSYRLPEGDVSTAQPLQLTLYWRGLEGTSPMNYVVFTHLLSADGRLIAQHDGMPDGGARPIDTWTPGEVITDLHPMAFYDAGYAGPARIVVGLYDPATGRVPTETGSDSITLPVTVNVVSQ
jgi:hypothetical protein